MTGHRKLAMLGLCLLAVLVLAALPGLSDAARLGLAGQVPILLGAAVAGNAAEHLSRRGTGGSAP